MKILKYLFFLILILIIGFSIYVATLDGSFQVEETLTVEAPSEMLFDEVNDYTTWEKWGPWAEKYPNLLVTYPEKTAGEGAGFSWKSDESKGSISTIHVIPGKSIDQEMTADTPFGEANFTGYWNFEKQENGATGTKITWGVKGTRSFWEKAYQLTQDSTLAEKMRPVMKTGLKNLAVHVEKAMGVYEISVNGTTLHSGGFYMYMTTAARNNARTLARKRSKILPQITLYMQQNNIAISGAPMTVFNNIDEQNGTAIISCGIPTSSRVITPEEVAVLSGFLPSQKVVKTTLKGHYNNLPEAWTAAKNYIAENNYEQNEDANPFEVYLTDPETTPNPAEWITEVYIPIK